MPGLWSALKTAAAGLDAGTTGHKHRRNAEKLISELMPMWQAWADLHPLARAARLLSDAEVDALCDAATRVSSATRAAYPKTHVQLKIHIIESHLIKFARRWRSVGLFAEDACESIHALINRLNRRFACVHGERKASCKRDALLVIQDPGLMAAIADRKKRRSRGSKGDE